MSDAELLKYDTRARERLLRSGAITIDQVKSYVESLPDTSEKCEAVLFDQPALHRSDSERHAAPTPPRSVDAIPRVEPAPAPPTGLGPTGLGPTGLGPTELGPTELGPTELGPTAETSARGQQETQSVVEATAEPQPPAAAAPPPEDAVERSTPVPSSPAPEVPSDEDGAGANGAGEAGDSPGPEGPS